MKHTQSLIEQHHGLLALLDSDRGRRIFQYYLLVLMSEDSIEQLGLQAAFTLVRVASVLFQLVLPCPLSRHFKHRIYEFVIGLTQWLFFNLISDDLEQLVTHLVEFVAE